MGMILRLNVKKLTGEQISVEAPDSQTIWDLKVQIGKKTQMSPYQLKVASQNGSAQLEDDAPLSRYGLRSGDTVALMIKEEGTIPVLLTKQQGRSSVRQIRPSMLVDSFRDQVAREERVPKDQFWLMYQDKILEDGHKMSEYNIRPHGTIFLNMRLRGG